MNPDSCLCSDDQSADSLLWSLTDYDRFCPWCGGQVRRLTSSSFFQDEDNRKRLVLYPSAEPDAGSLEFETPLALEYHDGRHELRVETVRLPVLQVSCRAQNADVLVDCKIVSGPDGSALILSAALRSHSGKTNIPDAGVLVDVQVEGDFPKEEWLVLLCRQPRLQCRLVGTGVRPRHKPEAQWEITRYAMLSLTLQVQVEGAPVYVARTSHRSGAEGPAGAPVRFTVRVQDDEEVKIEDEFRQEFVTSGHRPLIDIQQSLRPGQRLNPSLPRRGGSADGDAVAIPLQLNCADFQSDWIVRIYVDIDIAGDPRRRTLSATLSCLCVDIGNIQFNPSQLLLPKMYAGEHRSNALREPMLNPEGAASDAVQQRWRLSPVVDRVEVRNEGSSEVTLRPEIEESADWIRVGWDTPSSMVDRRIDSADSRKLTLKSKDSCYLVVELDFRKRSESDEPLKSRVVLLDATEGADQRVVLDELAVLVQKVEPRSPAASPLFLDFGNSNTSATVIVHQNGARPIVRPGHHLDNTEHFPSVLLLNRLNQEDLGDANCLIGTFAVDFDLRSRGPDNSSRLVSSLKQRLCASSEENFEPRIPCKDQYNQDRFLTASGMLQLFLLELIERAETLLRGKLITDLVISYPARLSTTQRHAYLGAFQTACEAISRSPQRRGVPLRFRSDVRVDEANAVALGFVYSQDPADIRKIDAVLKDRDARMRVAAVDLGGGSLDIACIDFQNRSRLSVQRRLKSSYLWIGGDARFGGNNLTAAAFELLRSRLDAAFSGMVLPAGKKPEPQSGVEILLKRLRDLPSVDDHFHGRCADKGAVFMSLWHAAELVKLCALGAEIHRDDGHLSGMIAAALRTEPAALPPLDMPALWLTAADIEDHLVEQDQHGEGGYKVRDRCDAMVQVLRDASTRDGREVDFIVISGGASQWLYLREQIKRRFPHSTIEYVPDRLKSRVAEGLALAWPSLSSPSREDHPACSGNFTTAPIAAILPFDARPVVLFPVCTPFATEGENWRELKLPDDPDLDSATLLEELRRPLGTDVDQKWEVALCRLVTEDEWESLGRFVAGLTGPPCPPAAQWQRVDVRFVGDEDRIELRIVTKDLDHPPWQTALAND